MTDKRFHKIIGDISGIPVPEMFTFPFFYKPHPLVVMAADDLRSYISGREDWAEELCGGKMMGVLVAADTDGAVGYLAAFSGNLCHSNNHEFFVPAVYDILQPDGAFKREEAKITDLNRKVEEAERSEAMAAARCDVAAVRARGEKEVAEYRAYMVECKAERRRRREDGTDEAVLVAESQYQKAELKRLRRRVAERVAAADSRLAVITDSVAAMKAERHRRSVDLQRWVFDRFVVRNARGEQRSLTRIFADARGELPPAGAGECAAPKLLQYAYQHGLRPLAMGEFWVGRSPVGEVRRDGCFYGACKGKCEPILNFMLQGLDVEPNPLQQRQDGLRTVYEDDALWVVDKPSGMLSAPGKTGGESVAEIARRRCPDAEGLMVVHRLDMHTSGLLVVAKTREAFSVLRRQFEQRQVRKIYTALLDGVVESDEGDISLPLTADWHNRPRQKVDTVRGKEALTHYKVLERRDGMTRVEFYPQTGRTHQLRVHAAYAGGLNAPIHGDALYGTQAERLCLHASYVEFTHPLTGEKMAFSSKPEF